MENDLSFMNILIGIIVTTVAVLYLLWEEDECLQKSCPEGLHAEMVERNCLCLVRPQ